MLKCLHDALIFDSSRRTHFDDAQKAYCWQKLIFQLLFSPVSCNIPVFQVHYNTVGLCHITIQQQQQQQH